MLDSNQQAILMLTARFGPAQKGEPTPLTPIEYGRFSRWLHSRKLAPKDLMSDIDAVMNLWDDPKGKVTSDRVSYLFGRGVAMGIALDKWTSAGLWILTRADKGYPIRLRKALGDAAPAVFFGVGNPDLLQAGGLAIVGSRHIRTAEEDFTARLANCAAASGMNVVSGGARGVDEAAMLAALRGEGTALGVLGNGLLDAALSDKWRDYLQRRDLCLASTFFPEASFHVGNAMARNKYLYALSDFGMVIRSEKGKGGTWAGATEALKKSLAPVFVHPDSDADGNAALLELGAYPLNPPEATESMDESWLRRALAGVAPASAKATSGEQQELY